MNKSIWLKDINSKKCDKLKGNTNCDILIIGGGIAGLSCAYFLKDSKYKTILVDACECGMGATAYSSAKLSFVQSNIYQKLSGNNKKLYFDSQKGAINLVRDIVKNNNIDCDLEESPSYLFTEDEDRIKDIKKEEVFYKENNIKYDVCSKLPNGFPCKYAIKLDGNYVFNPVKYLFGIKDIIKSKIKIYENTRAIDIEKSDGYYYTKCDGGRIKSKIVIICCHYPFFIKPLFIPLKTNVERSYLVASKVSKNMHFNAINTERPTHSMRYVKFLDNDYLLYVSGSHNISGNYDKKEILSKVIKCNKLYFNKDVDMHFANQDIMTIDSIPYIGEVDDNMFVATGFNTWGMTNGTISGKVISDIILGNDNRYIDLFNPKRMHYNIIKLCIYGYHSMKAYVVSKICTNYSFYGDKVKIIHDKGKRIGIYIDDNGRVYKVSNVCPHMKCNLIFNNDDKTWDCPCHGSRFDIRGNVLMEPAKNDISLDRK